MSKELTIQQTNVITHSLGLNYSKEAYRNHFCADPGHSDFECCESLVSMGLMTKRKDHLNEMRESFVFHVTEKGKATLKQLESSHE